MTNAELALDKDGKFLAMRVNTTANMGAYLSTFASCVPTILYATLLAGQYTTPAIYCEVTAVFTNTAPVDAYRGAGRPEATYVVERLVSTAAREMKISEADIRRRNFIKEFPYQTPVALCYDTGNYEATLDRGDQARRRRGFRSAQEGSRRARQAARAWVTRPISKRAASRRRTSPARSARAPGCSRPAKCASIRPASVTVFTGSHSHGQGHETTFAQVVADRLGIGIDDVDVVHGDTGRIPFGMGTYGSRSLSVGGTAIVKALDKVIAKGKKDRRAPAGGGRDRHRVQGRQVHGGRHRPQQVPFAEIALAAYVPHNYPLDKLEPGLDETAFYDPTNFTFPAGTHICEVEIDPDTGSTRIVNFAACDDFGNIINPMIVEGQVHGGVAQGIGQALLEGCVYDKESGQLLTGSYMDYAMPRADDLPSFKVATKVTPCTHNPLGAKGCGEAGAIGAPAAMMNAVHDALSAVGVKRIDMPASPHRVWQAIQIRQTVCSRRIHMYSFELKKADSVANAAALLAQSGGKPLAGGQSLVAAMKMRLAQPSALVDLSGIAELKGIRKEGDNLVIGAMTRHAEVAASKVVKDAIPALAALAEGIGDRQVRNRGTIGGSLANNDPAADYPAAVLALGATVQTNKRKIAADEFFKGMYETALADAELITSVSFPIPKKAAYMKFVQPASRFALVGVFVAQTQGGVRVAVTGAAPSVFRSKPLEDALTKNFTADAAKAVKIDAAGLNNDLHGSAEYRAHLVSVLASRAVAAAG